ncbi:hypothetical protein MPTK1_4g19510 [Marchantia polymorpha subsp. ruderalis]|uniref:Uncharacterized protein n=2 Tax=Marchantia polymorpha TaxID=3197 RepID=A0AAF6BBL7_MARPO|nr:hypothetical protein MARPO_0126s0043 [Marchantia polymorpha]BBN09401.1 hypothetical protein Mp_4g19510 [Marchantia polymorpha subsp. ruderalis]|eukprot:PTQ30341.1 hypothetical protein MARPO_0126s0043 [Marchantia polymorpha]
MLHDVHGCYLLLILPPGKYEYHIILDGDCSYLDDVYFDVHRELEVVQRGERRFQEDFPMPLAIVGEGPESPKASYTSEIFAEQDLEEEPPVLTPHLSTTVFSSAHMEGEPSRVAAPQHMIEPASIMSTLTSQRGCVDAEALLSCYEISMCPLSYTSPSFEGQVIMCSVP